ncbi:APC family permease [Scopulibacillus cellulosilyticus]|uniref:APC family permease n=1 Tax=Scopulibacillus cellulosilyticus TaxID=2665665 RepID=A0ABW2Q1N8_9BACL
MSINTKSVAKNTPAKNNSAHLKRSLTLFPLLILGLSYMIPTAVFSPYGIVAVITHGRVPAAYLTALIMVAFTAYSYGRMIKAYPSSGSAYTYTQRTINPHLGFLVGWAVMLDYLFLPMLNVLASSIFLSAAIPFIPFWLWVILFTVSVTVVNILGIQVNAKISTCLILYLFLFVAIFICVADYQVMTRHIGTGSLFSMESFYYLHLSLFLLYKAPQS